MRKNKVWIWIGCGLGVLLLAAFAGLSYMAGSPKDAYGMVRYALPHMHRGTLKVGDDAPDARSSWFSAVLPDRLSVARSATWPRSTMITRITRTS
jgi:hypothetical protein